MTEVTDHIETDVRERILVAAERLFREIGYQKTTVADIAKALRMSPANVYRFFDSKKSINTGVARRLMGQVEGKSQAIAQEPGSAAKRLRQLLATIHRMNADRYVGDAKNARHGRRRHGRELGCLQGAHRLHHRHNSVCDRRRRRVRRIPYV